jgi:hypothetical protein
LELAGLALGVLHQRELVGTMMGCFVLPPTKDLPHGARFDWNGAPLIAAALTTVMVVLNEGYAWGRICEKQIADVYVVSRTGRHTVRSR